MPDVNAALRALAAGSVVRAVDSVPAAAASEDTASDREQGNAAASTDSPRANMSTALHALARGHVVRRGDTPAVDVLAVDSGSPATDVGQGNHGRSVNFGPAGDDVSAALRAIRRSDR